MGIEDDKIVRKVGNDYVIEDRWAFGGGKGPSYPLFGLAWITAFGTWLIGGAVLEWIVPAAIEASQGSTWNPPPWLFWGIVTFPAIGICLWGIFGGKVEGVGYSIFGKILALLSIPVFGYIFWRLGLH